MIKGIVFDLDGVLTNTSVYHYKAWRKLAKEKMKYEFTQQDNTAFLGVSRKDCMILLEGLADIELKQKQREEYLRIKNSYYLNYLSALNPSRLNQGARELLDECRQKGLKTAVASASKNTMIVLEKTEITSCFDAIIDGKSVKRAKPDPECFVLAALRLGLKPNECIVIEDAQAGIDGALGGGCRCIGIGIKPLRNAEMHYEHIKDLQLTQVLAYFEKTLKIRKGEYCGSKD